MPESRAIDAILKNFDNSRDITHVDPNGTGIANTLAGANPVSTVTPVQNPSFQNVPLPPQDDRGDPRNSISVSPEKIPEFIAKTPSAADVLNSVLNKNTTQASDLTPAQARERIEARNRSQEQNRGADNIFPEPESAEVKAEGQAQESDEIEQLIAGDDAEIPQAHPIAENFKKLKKVYKETKEKFKEVETRAAQAEARVKEYETGAAVPEIIQTLENKVAQATKWEKLHNLKMSPEYQKEFTEPLNKTTERLNEIAKDYGYSEDIVNEALGFNSEAKLNSFLAENFDPVGAIEVKQLVSKAKEIAIKAKEAEHEPESILQRLKEEQVQREAALEEQRINKITATAKSSWSAAIDDLQREGKMTEIIHRPDDPEHNEFFVKPILTQAGQEYGKLVTMLTKAGLKELPAEVSKALALMTARAHASAVATESRNHAVKQLNEMQGILDRVTNARSPSIGSAHGRGSGEPAAGPKGYSGDTTLATAAGLLNQVLSRK